MTLIARPQCIKQSIGAFLILVAFLFPATDIYAISQRQSFAPDSVINFYLQKINPDSIQSHMQTLENFETRFCLAGNRREVAAWIRDKFLSFGYQQVELDSFALNTWYGGVYYQTWQYNVICSYEGYRVSDSTYILGAHYDAIVPLASNPFINAPGADDNASGLAATLEIARIMKHYNYKPAYNIIFIAFAAEELGLHGSWNYANKAFSSAMNIICMLNNDMVSYCTLPPENWAVRLQKYPNSIFFNNLAHQIVSNYTILSLVESTQYLQYSDSWPFYQKGYQAVFFIENQFTPHYHTLNDLVSTTNKLYAAEVTKISLGILVYMNGSGSDPNAVVPNILYVADTIIENNSSACFAAAELLVVGGENEFTALEGSIVELISGESISMLAGVHIAEGAYCHAHITEGENYCAQTRNLLAAGNLVDKPNEYYYPCVSNQVKIFPNPTTGLLNIWFEKNELSGSVIFRIFNSLGQNLRQIESAANLNHTLNLSEMQPGIYLLHINHGDTLTTCKIIRY